jgi:hypothetical protein
MAFHQGLVDWGMRNGYLNCHSSFIQVDIIETIPCPIQRDPTTFWMRRLSRTGWVQQKYSECPVFLATDGGAHPLWDPAVRVCTPANWQRIF